MSGKRLTRTELLVVIGAIVFLVGTIVLIQPRTRALSDQMVCGANLAGIGNATAFYSQDNNGDYPAAGGPEASWDTLGDVSGMGNWKGWSSKAKRWGAPPNNKATITSCLYLLVRYGMAEPKQFVCRGDGATIYRQPQETPNALDFGDGTEMAPGLFCSYSYHMPFSVPDLREGHEGELTNFAISEKSADESPVCGDRNPFLDEHLADSKPAIDDNCYAHGGKGQNVLYRDMHVDFEKSPLVGIGGDNIWCYWDGADEPPQFVGDDGPPAHRTDAYLVNEYQRGRL